MTTQKQSAAPDQSRHDDETANVHNRRNDGHEEARLKILELELRSDLASQIKSAVAAEKAQLQSYWSFAGKVAAIAATVVGVALGVIGWQGWKDISDRIDERVGRRLDEHLKASPPAKYEQDVKRLYDRAVVHTYSAEIPRRSPESALERLPHAPTLVPQDWVTMLSLLSNPDTDDATCEQILRILNYHGGFGSLPKDGVVRLRSLAFAQPLPEWLGNAPKRRAYLILALTELDDRDGAVMIRRLLTENTTPPDVQRAALRYLRELFIFEAAADVEQLVASPGIRADVESEGVRTLAVLSPNSARIKALIARIDAGQGISQKELYMGLAIVSGLAKLGLGDHVESHDDVVTREKLATHVLESLLNRNFQLKAWASQVRLVFRTAALENQDVPLDILLSHELSDIAGNVFANAVAKNDLKAVRQIVERFGVGDSTVRKWHFLPHLYHFSGTIGLQDAKTIEFGDTANGVWLAIDSSNVVVYWVDLSGVARSSVLQSVDRLKYAQGLRIERSPDWLSGTRWDL